MILSFAADVHPRTVATARSGVCLQKVRTEFTHLQRQCRKRVEEEGLAERERGRTLQMGSCSCSLESNGPLKRNRRQERLGCSGVWSPNDNVYTQHVNCIVVVA